MGRWSIFESCRNNYLPPAVEPAAVAPALMCAALVVALVEDAVVNSQILPSGPHASPQTGLVSFGPCHLELPSASRYIVEPSRPGEQLAAAFDVVLFAVAVIVAIEGCSRL